LLPPLAQPPPNNQVQKPRVALVFFIFTSPVPKLIRQMQRTLTLIDMVSKRLTIQARISHGVTNPD
jgi:hypothetical protein